MTKMAQSKNDSLDIVSSYIRTAASSSRLNQIEKLRENGVGELVALPQLVVCGDQSAGKSSVLEAITGIPFPRKEGMCTRFPTEIILRHSEASKTILVTASVRAHTSRSPEAAQTLSAYRRTVESLTQLPSIIDDVSKLMRLRGFTNLDEGDGQAFASDALRIEISGPTGLHLSVVDLPGLISVPNEEQTEDDVDAVFEMARSYLRSSRTIILAVTQAGNDMANQSVIRLAREYDSQGQRTVGIITKPDLINEGTEPQIAIMAKNEGAIKLQLGFFLLRNPSPKDILNGINMQVRAKNEYSFFSTPPWSDQSLDPDRLGADNLRKFLQDLLDSHIEREMPKVRDEFVKTLNTFERELKSLGEARVTTDHIRLFLPNLSMQFHDLSQAALDGNYQSSNYEFFSESEVCRLRARIQGLNTDFATKMREHGQRRKISNEPASPTSEGFESADRTAELLVTKAEMMEWIKKVWLLRSYVLHAGPLKMILGLPSHPWSGVTWQPQCCAPL